MDNIWTNKIDGTDDIFADDFNIAFELIVKKFTEIDESIIDILKNKEIIVITSNDLDNFPANFDVVDIALVVDETDSSESGATKKTRNISLMLQNVEYLMYDGNPIGDPIYIQTLYSADGSILKRYYGKNSVPVWTEWETVYVSKSQHETDLATKADKDGVYELIEEITITEDNVSRLYRDVEPDGTAYAFKAMLIKGVVEAGVTSGRVSIYFKDDSLTVLGACDSALITTAKRYIKAETFKRHGLMVCEWVAPSSTIYANTIYRQNDYGEVIATKEKPITNISISSTTSGVTFPIGSIFKIYGVR